MPHGQCHHQVTTLRQRLEMAIESNLGDQSIDAFISLLDDLDGDWDLEPSFGSYPAEECEEGADDELAIGSPDSIIDQTGWGGPLVFRYFEDCELDVADLEPSLGWSSIP